MAKCDVGKDSYQAESVEKNEAELVIITNFPTRFNSPIKS